MLESCALLAPGTRVRITGNNRTRKDIMETEGSVVASAALGGWHTVRCTVGDRSGLFRVQRNALEVVDVVESDAFLQQAPPQTTGDHASEQSSRALGTLKYSTLRKYRQAFGLRIQKQHTKDELLGVVRSHFANWKISNEGDVIRSFVKSVTKNELGVSWKRKGAKKGSVSSAVRAATKKTRIERDDFGSPVTTTRTTTSDEEWPRGGSRPVPVLKFSGQEISGHSPF